MGIYNLGLLAVLFVVLVSGVDAVAEPVVIVGTVNDDYQIVTDDEKVFDIGYGEISEKLADEVGKRARVTCEIETDEDGTTMIQVISYEILSGKANKKQH